MITTSRQRDGLQLMIDDLLLFCSESRPLFSRSGGKSPVSPSDFGVCDLAALNGDSSDMFNLLEREGHYFNGKELSIADLPKSWSASVCTRMHEQPAHSCGFTAHIGLLKADAVPSHQVRGRGRMFSDRCICVSCCFIDTDTREYVGSTGVYNWNGSRWIIPGGQGHSHQSPTVTNSVESLIYSLMGVQFTRDLLWYVHVNGVRQGLSIQIPTSPQGAMAAFKDRDKSRTGRRDALLHWVKEHYRRKRVDGELTNEMVEVCQHLRGRIPFRWRGLDCELVAAPFDVRRYAAAKERKKTRKSNRV